MPYIRCYIKNITMNKDNFIITLDYITPNIIKVSIGCFWVLFIFDKYSGIG